MRKVPYIVGGDGGYGGGGCRGIAAPYAGRAGGAERREGKTEEGGELEERRPEHYAGGDPHRPAQQTDTAYAAADHRKRGLLLGHRGFDSDSYGH